MNFTKLPAENIRMHPAAASAARSAAQLMAVQLAAAEIDLDDRLACERHLRLDWWGPFVRQFMDDAIAAASEFKAG